MKLSKLVPPALLAVAFIGFLDAVYLTVQHYLGFDLNCPITGSCSEVLNSPYAILAGIPISLLGAVYYLSIIILTTAYLDAGKPALLKWAAYLTVPGFLAALGLLYLQFFVIEALCFYCLISAAVSTVLFALGLTHLISSKQY